VGTRGLIVVLFVVIVGAGCGGSSDVAEPVKVEGDEYAFVMPDEAEAGVIRFQISNVGDDLHEYALGRLDQGKTIEDVKAFLASGGEDAPEWFTDVGGVPVLSPGEELTLTRELPPATYVFLCFLPAPSGEPHVSLGMLKSFELTGDSGSKLPEPDAVITANGAGYDMPTFEAGQQTIKLRNADDREREFFLIALSPGKSLQDLESFFEKGENKGEPPATFHGAMQTIPPGSSVFIDMDLQAGVEYTLADNTGSKPVVVTFTPE
jgi:hypothetical protein